MSKNSKGQTIIRFFSIRDAIVAKHYLSSLVKYTTGINGVVEYRWDKSAMPVKSLGWEAFNVIFHDRLMEKVNDIVFDDDLQGLAVANGVGEQQVQPQLSLQQAAGVSVPEKEAEFRCTYSMGNEEHYEICGDTSSWPTTPKKKTSGKKVRILVA